jgi:arylsulfatase A-like enzyme
MKPNILWLCADQLRYDTLGCYGDPFVETPHIDRLTAMGTRFTRAYCQSPVCAPSRASFLTGRYPRTVRVRQNGQDIPAYERLVPKILTEHGYVCGLSGKLHLSACHPSVCPGIERRIDDGYAAFHWSHEPGHTDGSGWPGNEYVAWLKENGIEHTERLRDDCRFVEHGIPQAFSQTQWCTDKAIGFIQAAQAEGKPWLFSVNWFDPHHAFDPPDDLMDKYIAKLDEMPLPGYTEGELDGKPLFQRKDHGGSYDRPGHYAYTAMNGRDHKMLRAAYYAMIELIDIHVGRLLDYLEESGQLDNTLILFHTDHGEMLGDHGIYLKGPYFYEQAVRVPLIAAYGKRFTPGAVYEGLTELTDLAPTILEACGIAPEPGMQGVSLYREMMNPAGNHRDSVYCEYYNANIRHRDPKAYLTMVRDDRYKLVRAHFLEDGQVQGELYDLLMDPSETINRYHDAAYLEIKTHMLERMTDRMAATADPLPVRRAAW